MSLLEEERGLIEASVAEATNSDAAWRARRRTSILKLDSMEDPLFADFDVAFGMNAKLHRTEVARQPVIGQSL